MTERESSITRGFFLITRTRFLTKKQAYLIYFIAYEKPTKLQFFTNCKTKFLFYIQTGIYFFTSYMKENTIAIKITRQKAYNVV